MSEYISFEIEATDHPDCVLLGCNLNLAANGREQYSNRDEGDQGSPLAQTLFGITGLAALGIEGSTLTVWREPDTEWYALIDDVTKVVRDFFL